MSWRKAHFARRSKIDRTYVKLYSNEVVRAVVLYGWNRVYNVDETSIRINKCSSKTVAPIGTEQVVIDQLRNDKECYTTITTRTRTELLSLIIVSKGKTDQSKAKFQVGEKTEIILSDNRNGWTNEQVFLKYLDIFHEMIGKKDYALILNCLSAKRTPKILKKAAQLNIQLIFVPDNSKGYYQPLDRHIFGVLKAKLRSLSASKTLNGPQRYVLVTKYLLKAWNSMKSNENLLTSAWNIPKLFDLVYKKEKKFGEDDDAEYKLPEFEEKENNSEIM